MKGEISTEANINNARTVTSSKIEGEVILKYSSKNLEISNTKID